MDRPSFTAIARELEDARIEILAPAVGLWRGAPELGAVVPAGGSLGELEVLGVIYRLVAPRGGAVAWAPEGPARAHRPLGYGARMVVLDPEASAVVGAKTGSAALSPQVESGALAFRAPSSGRFYGRPAPDKPPFVSAGDEIATGHTICLIEVMKTFNRIAYGGDGLPPSARVVRVVPADGDDLDAGDPILELE